MKITIRGLILLVSLLAYSSANAYSVQIDCKAYAVGDLKFNINHIEIKSADHEGQYGALTLFINGTVAELISSSQECDDDLECNVIKGYPISFIHPNSNIGLILNLNPGADRLFHSEPMRGGYFEQRVYEISPTIRGGGKSLGLAGICYRNI